MRSATWQGRPIASQQDSTALDLASATYEFGHGLARHEAEHRAHTEYVREQRLKAAAHHLSGIKAAQAAGNMEEAQRHGALYSLHVQAAGLNPVAPVPPEVQKYATAPDAKGAYRFRASVGDIYALPELKAKEAAQRQAQATQQPLQKREPGESCEWEPTKTTKALCRNPRSRKVGDTWMCHWHADLHAKKAAKAHKDEAKSEERLTTPATLTKSAKGDGPSWQSSDGLSIPRDGTPNRRRWDKAFMEAVRNHFGDVGPVQRIPVNQTVPGNRVANGARVDLYRRMAEAEGKVPPVVIRRHNSDGPAMIVDGNHRLAALRQAGITHVDAVEERR